MKKDVKLKRNSESYIENDKKYIVKNKRRKRVLKPTVKIAIYLIFAIVVFLFALYMLKLGSISRFNNTSIVNYSLTGNADYKVFLKENDYYKQEYLKSGMQYIANLIKTVDLDFNYEAHATDELDYHYKYNIIAKTIVNDKNNKDKILFEEDNYLVKEKELDVNDTNFVIKENVPIDYEKYNDYIIKYKKEYSLNAEFNLIVDMHVETTIKSKVTDKDVVKEDDLKVIIPLSEQTVNISFGTNKIEVNESIVGDTNKTLSSRILYGCGIVLGILAIMLLIKALIIVVTKDKGKNLYNNVINKYLKEYDRAIVTTHKSNVDENMFDQVIRIASIEEMLDLHDNFQTPILYYEVIKGEKSYFIIIKDNILYKLTISKAWLDANNGDKR